jgi:hypothetical protein
MAFAPQVKGARLSAEADYLKYLTKPKVFQLSDKTHAPCPVPRVMKKVNARNDISSHRASKVFMNPCEAAVIRCFYPCP